MIDDPIGVLEERAKALELKVFGQYDSIPEITTSVIDNLLESHKVISSALSGREKIASVVKRLDQLETVLDPMYEDSVVDSAAKLAFILSMEQELEQITKQLVRVNELSPCLKSEHLRNLPNLMRQMAKLTSLTVEQRQQYSQIEDSIDDLINKYTEIINGITAVFSTLDNVITDLEIKAQPKHIIE